MAKTPKPKKRKLVKKVKEEQPSPEQRIDNTTNKKLKTIKHEKPQPSTPTPQPPQNTDSGSGSGSGSGSDSDSDSLPKLLEPYSKDQLLDLISAAAHEIPALLRHIRHVADRDVSHRKIFVHGLGWDTTRETLLSAFEPFGEIEDCTLVPDKATGKAKGYGFVLFKTRKAADEALRNPKKKIGNRVASWQLASVGPGAPPDVAGRRIYVSNVPPDADAEKLRQFFTKFGEIEMGPFGFDSSTGKFRGFALFVFKSDAGAKNVLEEPYKLFEGHRLHCQKATEGKGKNPAQAQPRPQLPVRPPPAMAAVATAQNLAMFAQHPWYGGFAANPGALNPALMAGTLNQGLIPTTQSVLGSYGGSGTSMQHVYPNTQMGQPGAGSGGSISGYPSYMWYDILQLNFLYVISMFIVLDFAFSAIFVLIVDTFIITTWMEVKFWSGDVICALLFNWFVQSRYLVLL
jgi:heterogeneous nuclear ribonucleoprotein A1/A3